MRSRSMASRASSNAPGVAREAPSTRMASSEVMRSLARSRSGAPFARAEAMAASRSSSLKVTSRATPS